MKLVKTANGKLALEITKSELEHLIGQLKGGSSGLKQTSLVHRRNSPVIPWEGRKPLHLMGPSKGVSIEETNQIIQDAMSKLTPEEADVIKKLFGFDGERMDAEAIAEDLGVDVGRINDLETSGTRKFLDYFSSLGGKEFLGFR